MDGLGQAPCNHAPMIVALSRRIAVALSDAIGTLGPEWITDDDRM